MRVLLISNYWLDQDIFRCLHLPSEVAEYDCLRLLGAFRGVGQHGVDEHLGGSGALAQLGLPIVILKQGMGVMEALYLCVLSRAGQLVS